MVATISNLTVVAVIMHALLGCCWHHAHDCARACPGTLSAEHEHASGQAVVCDGDHQPGHSDHGRSHSCKCDGVRCALVASPPSKAPSVGAPWYRGAGPAAILPAAGLSPQRGTLARVDDGGPRPPSVRPHLLHQVLLL